MVITAMTLVATAATMIPAATVGTVIREAPALIVAAVPMAVAEAEATNQFARKDPQESNP